MAKKKSKKRTLVALVLDSSGSMSSMKSEAIDLFNGQLEAVRKGAKGAGETKLSLVVFGVPSEGKYGPVFYHGVDVVHKNQGPDKVEPLTAETYQPCSLTPMRDGIGTAISLLEAEDDGGDDTAFLVVVVTDGQENASKEWSAATLSKKVADLQATGRWTFALYGCDDLDLAELRETSGLAAVPVGNLGTYKRGADGMAQASYTVSNNTAAYMANRSAGMTATVSFVEDE